MATQATPKKDIYLARMAYPSLMRPKTSTFNGVTKTQYEGVLLLPKDQPAQVEALRVAIRAAFAAKFGAEAKLSKDKQPMKDGDEPTTEDAGDKGKYPGYFYANVSAYATDMAGAPIPGPVMKHSDGSVMTDPTAFKSGDWAYVAATPRAYAFDNSKGVSLKIIGLRMVKKGDPIGGGSADKADALDALDALEIETAAPGEDDF